MPKSCAPKKRRKSRRKNPVANPKRRTHKGQHCVAWKRGKKRSTKHTAKKGHRKSRKHVLAGRKGAATRASRRHYKKYGSYTHGDLPGSQMAFENPVRRRRRRRRGGRRHNPVHHRRYAHHRHPFMRRNPLANPMGSIAEVFSGILGVGTGYVFADAIDRLLSTHALTPNVKGNGYTDTPPAGQLWDSEASILPIWSSWQRILAAAVLVFTPGMASRFVRGSKGKAFLQLASYGAGAKVGGKLLTDGLALAAAKMSGTVGPVQTNLLRLYAPEVAVAARLSQVQGNPAPLTASAAGTSPTQPAGMLAGPPRGVGRGLDPDACGVSPCSPIQPAGVITDAVASQQAMFDGSQPNYGPSYFDSVPFDPQNPLAEDCAPLPMQPLTYNNLPGGTQTPSPPSLTPPPAIPAAPAPSAPSTTTTVTTTAPAPPTGSAPIAPPAPYSNAPAPANTYIGPR